MQRRRPPQLAPSSGRRDDDGFVAVWFALALVLLIGMAAFAVDVAGWHLSQTREQRAADAAALAGAVSFPSDPPAANAAAQSVAASNGYPVGGVAPLAADGSCPLGAGTVNICAGPGDQPYQYKLKIVERVKNNFGGIFGLSSTVVSATATAEYLRPLSMGSPSNQYGNDPDASFTWPVSNPPPQGYPNFWANIAGGYSSKQYGDAYAAGYCDIPIDGCNGSGPGTNADFKTNGYYYTVDLTSGASVDLQVFDPAFVEVGDHCTVRNLAGAATLAKVPGYPQGDMNTADIAKRYAPPTTASQTDPGLRYCTGDELFNDHGPGAPAATTYTVWKATVPGDPGSAQPVTGCPSVTYPGTSHDLKGALQNGYTEPGAPGLLSTYFRQWVTLCSVSGGAGDEYFIQVQTDSASQGHNRFALRGVQGGAPAPVNIAGNAYMGMYANVGGTLTQFYLARVPSAAAGHTLVLNLYDIGDAAAGSIGSLKVVPPPDSNVGSDFSGCDWTGNSASGAVGYARDTRAAPWGPLSPITDCKITGVNDVHDHWNAQWNTVTIPIPSNYTCSDSLATGCWVRINYKFSSGLHDTTSWNAFLLGDPVRLVK